MRPDLLNMGLAAALGFALQIAPMTPASAQGVPVVDTQNIAQSIQQLRQMIEDEILQNEQLVQLREQLATLTEQLAELQRTYEALTRLAELPEIIRTQMEEELNGLLDQEFGEFLLCGGLGGGGLAGHADSRDWTGGGGAFAAPRYDARPE